MNSERKAKYGPMGCERLVPSLDYAYRIESNAWTGAVQVETVKLKLATDENLETLAIFTGVDENGAPVVGFHSAVGMLEALAGGLRRIATGQMRWKADAFRQ